MAVSTAKKINPDDYILSVLSPEDRLDAAFKIYLCRSGSVTGSLDFGLFDHPAQQESSSAVFFIEKCGFRSKTRTCRTHPASPDT